MELRCAACSDPFDFLPEDLAFLERISPIFSGTKHSIPPPKLCPACRFQRRLTYRNEYQYFSRECGACHRKVISVHPPENAYPVYCYECWWSDSWDPGDFGAPFDPKRPFFDQFRELYERTPQLALMNDNGVASENSEYCQDISRCKNCYLVTGSWHARDSLYGTQVNHVQDVVDCFLVSVECELVYESSGCQRLYRSSHLVRSSGCSDCHLGIDLRGCKDCVACIGLRQKRFCIFNEDLGENEYRRRLEALNLGSHRALEELKARFREFSLRFPRRASQQVQSDDCIGDSLYNCRDLHGFGYINGEHCRHIWLGDGAKHSYDVMSTGNPQWCYECGTPDDSYQVCFSTWVWKSQNVFYSDNCHSSESLFGCIGMKRRKHCVLNLQCSQSEYENVASAIVEQMRQNGEWGEYFPMAHSPFSYNDTRAADLFPLSESQVVARGLRWRTQREPRPASPAMIPDNIVDVSDTILQTPLGCGSCGRAYRLTPLELAFYRKMTLPVPRSCPDCRRRSRVDEHQMSGFLYLGQCGKCDTALHSVYPPGSEEMVLCDRCYDQALYA